MAWAQSGIQPDVIRSIRNDKSPPLRVLAENILPPQSGEVLLTVYDLLGKEVARIVNGQQPAGYHEVIWDASSVASGIYFYRLHAGDFVLTRKMVLLK